MPARAEREWMASTDERFANRCLPLLIANQSGWCLLNTSRVRAFWNGGSQPGDVSIDLDGSERPPRVSAHFGYGILTWTVPYLFRTPPGYDLLARGPANMPKDGIAPLEGVVETDWSVATFTMNWKFTRPGEAVFEQDEPFCMIVPFCRGDLARFLPRVMPIEADESTRHHFCAWQASRESFNRRLRLEGSKSQPRWQKHYFRGTSPSGKCASDHETRLALSEFVSGCSGIHTHEEM